MSQQQLPVSEPPAASAPTAESTQQLNLAQQQAPTATVPMTSLPSGQGPSNPKPQRPRRSRRKPRSARPSRLPLQTTLSGLPVGYSQMEAHSYMPLSKDLETDVFDAWTYPSQAVLPEFQPDGLVDAQNQLVATDPETLRREWGMRQPTVQILEWQPVADEEVYRRLKDWMDSQGRATQEQRMEAETATVAHGSNAEPESEVESSKHESKTESQSQSHP